MPEISDLIASCDALVSDGTDDGQRKRHAALLRDGLNKLAEEIRDLRAQRESLEDQVMSMAEEDAPQWENVLFLFDDEDGDDDDEPDFDPAA